MPEKDVGMRIRIDRSLRDKFLEACRAQDRPAAQIIREFMRDYVAERDSASDEPIKGKDGTRRGN